MKTILIGIAAIAITFCFVFSLIQLSCGAAWGEEPKIKAIFWDANGTPWQHATEKVRIDLDNGHSIFLELGEEMPQYHVYKFKIDKPEMPPGYTLMCSADGLFTFRDSDGFVPNVLIGSTKEKVVEVAWSLYRDEEIDRMNRNRTWKDCK